MAGLEASWDVACLYRYIFLHTILGPSLICSPYSDIQEYYYVSIGVRVYIYRHVHKPHFFDIHENTPLRRWGMDVYNCIACRLNQNVVLRCSNMRASRAPLQHLIKCVVYIYTSN